MIRNMKAGIPTLFKGGTKHLTGVEAAVVRNIEVCQQLSAITRTSLGPNGMYPCVDSSVYVSSSSLKTF